MAVQVCAEIAHVAPTVNHREHTCFRRWWTDASYLSFRDALPVNSSYFYVLNTEFCRAPVDASPAEAQAAQAAAVVLPLLQEAERLWQGTADIDTLRKKPLCMGANRTLFHACRMPRKPADWVAFGSSGGDAQVHCECTSGAGTRLSPQVTHDGETVWVEDASTWSDTDHAQDLHAGYPVVGAADRQVLARRAPCRWLCVMREGQVFRVDYDADVTGQQLAGAFRHVLNTPVAAEAGSGAAAFVGSEVPLLTSAPRDTWAAAWERLETKQHNRKSMATLIGATLVVCLDAAQGGGSRCLADIARGSLHGHQPDKRGGMRTHNRWWDKACQVVVAPPTALTVPVCGSEQRAASGLVCPTSLIFEHALADGFVSFCVLSRLLKDGISLPDSRVPAADQRARPLRVTVVDWVPAPTPLLQEVQLSARDHAQQVLRRQRNQLSLYTGYGAAQVKRWRCSPDAWMQLAMQVAGSRTDAVLASIPDWSKSGLVSGLYQFWDESPVTCEEGLPMPWCNLAVDSLTLGSVGQYEPVQMRGFRRGRTETARGASVFSLRAIRALHERMGMGRHVVAGTDSVEAWNAIASATAAHSAACRAAAAGAGFDRHLFGLSRIAAGDNSSGVRLPAAQAALASAVLRKASTWRVSTSNISGGFLSAWGWGQVTPSGVGVAYSTANQFGQDSFTVHVAGLCEDAAGWVQPRVRVYMTELHRALTQMGLVAKSAAVAGAEAKL